MPSLKKRFRRVIGKEKREKKRVSNFTTHNLVALSVRLLSREDRGFDSETLDMVRDPENALTDCFISLS